MGQKLPPHKMATGAKMDDMVGRVIRVDDRKRQILQTASQTAGGLLTAENSEQAKTASRCFYP